MKRGLFVVVVAFFLVTAGCSPGGPSGGGEIDRAATLRVGVTTTPVNLDPAQARTYAGAAFYLDPIYDRLLRTSPDGELQPMLATSWEFINDGGALRLELRDDVTFSDGSPFNAEVAAANLERYLSDDAAVPVQTMLNSVESIEVVDDYTIDILVKDGRGADVPAMLADPAGYMVSGEALDNPDLDQNPVGSGPYEISEYVPNVSLTVQRRDAEYWGGEDQANFETITIDGVDDPRTLIDSMAAAQYDLILVDRNNRTDQMAEQGYHVVNPTTGYLGVMFNINRVPEFQDPRVRRAFSLAIDRQSIADVTLEGACQPSTQMLPPGAPGYLDELDTARPYDPERARALFAEAGVDSLDLSSLYIAASPTAEVAEAVQAMLAEVGVTVSLQSVTAPTQTATWLENTADMRMSAQTSMPDMGRLLLRGTDDPILLGFRSEAVAEASTGLIDASRTEEERMDIVEATNTAMVEETFNVIICHRVGAAIGSRNLVGLDEVGSLVRAGLDYRPLALTQ